MAKNRLLAPEVVSISAKGNKMAKKLVPFIVSLTVLYLIAGCPPTKPQTPPTPEPEPPMVEPQQPEPPQPQPPKPEPPKPKPDNARLFHQKCEGILKDYVNEDGMVDYKRLKPKRLELINLLEQFANLDQNRYNAWPKEDKIAFWINAYNIQMLKIIADNYPIQSSRIRRLFWPPTSIRHIKGIWNKYKFLVMDEEFTLYAVERRIFRQQFDDPRAFFALSRASFSGPPLRNEPFYGHKLYDQLDDQVRKFLAASHGFQIDQKDKIVYLSAILQPNWFGSEFIDKYGIDKKFKDHPPAVRAVLNFITNYISEPDTRFLELQNYSVDYISYDWRLNE
jgi:hypothetical protein